MHACQFIVALVLTVALQVAAQAGPLTLFAPEIIYECQSTTFSWEGGNPPFSFYWAMGYGGMGDDSNTGGDILVGTTGSDKITFTAPRSGKPYRFKLQDGNGQVSQIWSEIQQSSSCPTQTTPPFTTPAATTIVYTLTTAYSSSSSSSSSSPPPSLPPPFQTISPPVTLTDPFPGTTTSKPTIGSPSLPTPTNSLNNPAEPNPASPVNPTAGSGPAGSSGSNGPSASSGSSGDSPSGPGANPSGPRETVGPADGNSSGGSPTPNQTSRQGTSGQNPTQTASPLRNTTDGEPDKPGMSSQTIGAIIGTITGAFLLFVAFLCFRWRQRHQKKHRPAAILPGVGGSGDDLTTAVIPPAYEHPPPMRPVGFYPTLPARVLPTNKAARMLAPRRSSSSFGSEANPPSSLSAATWHASQRATSHRDSQSIYPEDEPPIASTSYAGQPPEPTAVVSSMRSPLSLQELIGRELDNILSSPDTYAPDSPLYTPSSLYARDVRGGFRVANATEASSSSGGLADAFTSSSSKLPLETSSNHNHNRYQRATTPLDDSSPRVAISRNEIEYLADLVAARITRGAHDSRTEQARLDTDGNQPPPPSYV